MSIKDDWDAFAAPMKQSMKNLGNAVTDKLDDLQYAAETKHADDESTHRNSCCLWKIIKWGFILFAICVILSECNNAPANDSGSTTLPQTTTQSVATDVSTNSQLIFITKQVEYADKCNIQLNRFPDEEELLANWIAESDENVVHVTTDNIFGADRYKITEKYDGYLYYGELKDGRPDGYGILFAEAETSSWLLTYTYKAYEAYEVYTKYGLNYRYIGHFSDGRFDGFGLLFTEAEAGCSPLADLRPYDETTGENKEDFLTWANHVEYFGEFSDGNKSGLGNSFRLSYPSLYESEIDLDNPSYYSIEVGKYKKDLLNGDNKQYIGGYLYYDGESKNDTFNGYGILYYRGTNIPSYEGEFQNDMRHGKGTSYSKTGEVIYTGKWEYDDYA